MGRKFLILGGLMMLSSLAMAAASGASYLAPAPHIVITPQPQAATQAADQGLVSGVGTQQTGNSPTTVRRSTYTPVPAASSAPKATTAPVASPVPALAPTPDPDMPHDLTPPGPCNGCSAPNAEGRACALMVPKDCYQ
jgi:hypothetical protein